MEIFSTQLGTYRERIYYVRGESKDGSRKNPDEFAVIVYCRDAASGRNVEVTKVDTAHGYTHLHRFYRRGEPTVEVDWGFWEAVSEMAENWQTYAERFERSQSDD